MKKPFIPYAKQSITADDAAAVSKALKGDWIARGPLVEKFEESIASYSGAHEGVVFSSGTAALKAAAWAAKIGPNDRFYTTPNTFIATIVGAMQQGVVPTFIDIDRNTGNMDLDLLLLNINQPSSRGKEVISPVHFAGSPMDMRKLNKKIASPDTVIIEDAAHALGSEYPSGERVGSCTYSDMTIFSFHPAKTITTGEGGFVTTNDPKLAHRLRIYRNNGIEKNPESKLPWHYEVQALTGNSNFSDFQAALGLSQLKRLDAFIHKRRRLVSLYRELLDEKPLIRCFDPKQDVQTAFHLFVVQIDFEKLGVSRAEVMNALRKEGIGTQVHYIPLYSHPVMKDVSAYFPEMEAYYAQALTLPLYPDLKDKEVQRVCEVLINNLR